MIINTSDIQVDLVKNVGSKDAVRVTHKPTGIVVESNSERSQHQNKHAAMIELKRRVHKYLYDKWDGKSIPPAYLEVEWKLPEADWVKGYVIHTHKNLLWLCDDNDPFTSVVGIPGIQFRKIDLVKRQDHSKLMGILSDAPISNEVASTLADLILDEGFIRGTNGKKEDGKEEEPTVSIRI